MFAVAPTDPEWIAYLRARPALRTVNFWTPTPWNVRGLAPGDVLFFLHKGPSPRKVAGYGYFSRYENMLATNAWARFGEANGAATIADFRARLTRIGSARSKSFDGAVDPEIGCLVLDDPQFLDAADQFTLEQYGLEFQRSIVKIKYFDQPIPVTLLERGNGRIAHQNDNRKERSGRSIAEVIASLSDLVTLDQPSSRAARREQKALRQLIVNGDRVKCEFCGEDFPTDLIVAAHVKSRACCTTEERLDFANNVLPLCTFGCDELFELGYVTVVDGKICPGPRSAPTNAVLDKVSELAGRSVSRWGSQNAHYFAWRLANSAQRIK